MIKSRLESLTSGILPADDFMYEEVVSLAHEHKILLEKYENHPDVTETKIELKRVQDEMERYQNFFDLSERDILLEEIQDLRNQLQFYLDSSARTCRRQAQLLQFTYSSRAASTIPSIVTESTEKKLHQERIQWTEAESKWISLVEELRTELEANRFTIQRQQQELDMEKKRSEDLKEAMTMAMEGHARMLEHLEEQHMELLEKHRKIQDGIDDVKIAAGKAGVKVAESKFINKLAAEISALKVERETEKQKVRDENKGLKAQLRDTAEAVEAAGELLVPLKEAEDVLATGQRRAKAAEQKMENACKCMEKLNTLSMAEPMHREQVSAACQDEDGSPSWFYGYDRCNI